MKLKIRGILLSKVLFRENDILTELLLENGKKISVLFFGAKSSRKNRSSYLELGHCLDIILSVPKNGNVSAVYTGREITSVWRPLNIRTSYRAFFLCCFYVEVINKVAVKDDLSNGQEEDSTFEGLYRVLSNAMYHLDLGISDTVFDQQLHLTIFLGKLLYEQGLAPNTDCCLFCHNELEDLLNIFFLPAQGGMSCASCAQTASSAFETKMMDSSGHLKGQEILLVLRKIRFSKFKDCFGHKLKTSVVDEMFSYFCFQNQLDQSYFRGSKFVI